MRVGAVLFNPRYSGGQDKSGSKIHDNTVTQSSPAAEQEANVIREVLRMAQATPEPDDLDQLLERTSLRQALRVCTWLLRFLYNCKNQTKKCCPLVTEEIEEVREWWIRRIQ